MILRKMNQHEIDDLLDKDIMELLGFNRKSKEEQDVLREKIITTVENRFWERVYQILKGKNLVDKFKEAGDDEEKQRAVFKEADIDPDGMFMEEALLIKVQLKTASDFLDNNAKNETSIKEE